MCDFLHVAIARSLKLANLILFERCRHVTQFAPLEASARLEPARRPVRGCRSFDPQIRPCYNTECGRVWLGGSLQQPATSTGTTVLPERHPLLARPARRSIVRVPRPRIDMARQAATSVGRGPIYIAAYSVHCWVVLHIAVGQPDTDTYDPVRCYLSFA